MQSKPAVAILMFSPSMMEARVMRQAMALSEKFSVTVLGMGKNPYTSMPEIRFVELTPDNKSLPAKLLRRAALYATKLGAVLPAADRWRYTMRQCWKEARRWLLENRMDVLIAHEPETAALAAEVKRRHGTKVILDLHEYSPRESDNNWQFNFIRRPHVIRVLKRWGAKADAALTVNEVFCDLYVQECSLPRPIAIVNAPRRLPEPRPARIHDGRIHLVHHGICSAARHLDLTVKALKLTKPEVVLHFQFANTDQAYLQYLKELADEVPGRVFFHEAVPYTEILKSIAPYHVGVCFVPCNTFNHRHGLANKFFDFVCAGLAVITGPNEAMARLTRENGFGWATEDFEVSTLAKVLNELTPESIAAAAARADEFSLRVNADTEHARLITLMEGLLAQSPATVPQ